MSKLASWHDGSVTHRFLPVHRRVWLGALFIVTWGALNPVSSAQTNQFEWRWAGLVHGSFTFNGNEVWCVEDGGRIRHRTTARGAWNFQQASDPVKDTLRRIFFVPDGTPGDGPTGWAVGDKGWVVKTTNGGTNWATLGTQMPAVLDAAHRAPYVPPYEQLYDVHFLDASRGWLCGLHGIWWTTNGGTTWTPCDLFMKNGTEISDPAQQDLLEEIEFYSIDIVDREDEENPYLGFAGSEPGLIFKTTDGIVWNEVFDVRCLCLQAVPCTAPGCSVCYDCTGLNAIDGCLGEPAAFPGANACELGICDGSGQPFEMWDVKISRHPTDKLVLALGGEFHQCGMIFSSADDGDHWKKESHECQSVGLPGGVDCSAAADTTYC